jgi:hypothetical protein
MNLQRTPDEILAFAAGEHVFLPADYPDAVVAVITAAGGAASDGTPGTTQHRAFTVDELPRVCRIHCGTGGRDGYGRRGQDGYVIIELYNRKDPS